MKIQKTHLSHLPMVYAVTAFRMADGVHFLAATELYGQWHHFAPPDYRPVVASHAPGGVLGFALLPGNAGRMLAIEQAYPIYHFDRSLISLAEPGEHPGALWSKRHLADLPYVHRIGIMPAEGGSLVVASTMCGPKAHQDDWSTPGTVYVCRLPEEGDAPLQFVRIHAGLSRNHGMLIASFRGATTLFVSGMEGVFALNHARHGNADVWRTSCLLKQDVSDMAVFDLDGDGREELIAIEPFHGDKVGIYRQTDEGWQQVLQLPAAFGHVAWAGMIRKRRCLLLGNRAGTQDLRLLVFRGDGSLEFESLTLDERAGPANVSVMHEPDRDLILSANHVRGEVALYEIRD